MAHRLLVTGGSGFIGRQLMRAATKRGAEVANFDIRAVDTADLRVREYLGDIRDGRAVGKTLRDFAPTAVVHLAARTDLDDRVGLEGYSSNVDGVRVMAQAVADTSSVEVVIWASTRLVFAIDHVPRTNWDYKPSTVYGVSKVVGESIVRERLRSLPTSVIVRPTSIWGPGFSEPYLPFFKAVADGRYVRPAGSNPLKSFGYVENTCHQLLALLQLERSSELHGQAVMLADYEPLDLTTWSNFIAASVKRSAPREVPLWLLRMVASAADHGLLPRVPLSRFRLNNLLAPMVYDTDPLRRLAPDLPFTWREGVLKTLDWMGYELDARLTSGIEALHV